jgi:hypothetical protein
MPEEFLERHSADFGWAGEVGIIGHHLSDEWQPEEVGAREVARCSRRQSHEIAAYFKIQGRRAQSLPSNHKVGRACSFEF